MSDEGDYVSLREYFEALRIADAAQLAATRRDLERRLEEMNALRAQIGAERGIYLTRSEYGLQHQILIDRLNVLTTTLATLNASISGGHAVSSDLWARGVAVISALAAIAAVIVVAVVH